MDADRFDTLAKRLVAPTTRRATLRAATAGGLLSALGLGRAVPPTRAAQTDTCVLAFAATVRLGLSVDQPLTANGTRPGELRGDLRFALSDSGALEAGVLRLPDGLSLPVVGQAMGHSLQLRIELAPRVALVAVGVGEQEIASCRGAIDGVLTGPAVGDLGDWHAAALARSESPGGTEAAAASPRVPTSASGPTGVTAATLPAGTVATNSATAASSDSTGATGPSALAGAAASAPIASTGPTGPAAESLQCAPGSSPCGGVCVDLSGDVNNCGACGKVCQSGLVAIACRDGECVRADCAAGSTYCGAVDGCRDLTIDPNHCGACQNSCASGVCAGGVCGTAQRACPAGQADCGGVCVDLSNDDFNCGACGYDCEIEGPNKYCQVGVCVDPVCPTGTTDCNGYCADLLTSPIHCGACGNVCGNVQVCQNGACSSSGDVCPIDRCGDFCVDLSSDPMNCGACGVGCGNGACVSGSCVGVEMQVDCAALGRTDCGGYCADTLTDASNCGACGVNCGSDPCISGVCTGVVGQPPPLDVVAPCSARGLTDCGGVCVDLLTDDNNCGACGNACYPGLCSYGDGTCTVCNDDVVVSGFCA